MATFLEQAPYSPPSRIGGSVVPVRLLETMKSKQAAASTHTEQLHKSSLTLICHIAKLMGSYCTGLFVYSRMKGGTDVCGDAMQGPGGKQQHK